jgi:hypothetical protein
MVIAAVVLFFVGGFLASAGAVVAILTGVVLFPILLPWLPTRDFSSKGFILGGLVALPFALAIFLGNPDVTLRQAQDTAWWLRVGGALTYLLALPPVTAYLALNFTGSTTFFFNDTATTEIYTYIPIMAWMFGTGIVLTIVLSLI